MLAQQTRRRPRAARARPVQLPVRARPGRREARGRRRRAAAAAQAQAAAHCAPVRSAARARSSRIAGANARAMSLRTGGDDRRSGLTSANCSPRLFQRGYLRGVQGEFATGLSTWWRAQSLVRGARLSVVTGSGGHAQRHRDSTTGWGLRAIARLLSADAAAQQAGRVAVREQAVTWHNLGRANESLGAWPEARQAFESLASA